MPFRFVSRLPKMQSQTGYWQNLGALDVIAICAPYPETEPEPGAQQIAI